MTDFQYYPNRIPYSISGTPFAAVFDSPDGSSSDPQWHEVISKLVSDGAKPSFNNVSDQTCAKAWMDLVPKLGFLPNILSIKITLAAGVSLKKDIESIFENNKNWIDQASFRGSLGDFLGIHNTQLVPLTMVVSMMKETKDLVHRFSDPEGAVRFLEENNLINQTQLN